MAITLGTNIPSYNTRMHLNGVISDLTSTMEKLSTGLKINKAGDDAAGLVISENMDALIRGSKQAQANIQNARSFLTIAEDGMVSIGDHLQRMNDLLVNMANDTNDIDSRTAAVQEIIERIDEINRLAEATNFNGRVMLGEKKENEKILVQMGPDNSASSVLDISRALTDCHVNKIGATLPLNLHPDAIEGEDGTAILEVTEGATKKYYIADGSEYMVSDGAGGTKKGTAKLVDGKTVSAYNPNNENCRSYMSKIQDSIATLATCRGLIGAYENRMDSSYDSLTTRIESLESAKSVYTDTDIAEEATNMTRQQIIQQYNVAILASANTIPQLALSLLG